MSSEKEILKNKIKHIIAGRTYLDVDLGEISSDQPLVELGIGVDSVSTLEFIMEIEEALGASIDESLLTPEVFDTVGSLSEFLLSLIMKGNR